MKKWLHYGKCAVCLTVTVLLLLLVYGFVTVPDAMTRAQTAQQSSVLAFGNITLDQSTYMLAGPGGSFRLANKEFQMLETLMANPHHLISSERFLEKIWGYDSEAEINVVWVYISYLRKKLAALNANVQIKATRNAGYSLEEKDV